MFENLDSKNGQNLSGNNASPLPTGRPVSQGGARSGFVSPPSQGGARGGSAPKVEDMFADVKDAAAPASKNRGAVPALPKASFGPAAGYSSNVLRNLIIIIIVLLILLAGVFLAARFVGSAGLKNIGEQFSNLKGLIIKENKPGTTILVNNEKPAVPENNGNNNPAANTPLENIPVNNVPAENTPAQPAAASTATMPSTTPAAIIDTDGDGLSDAEEGTLGTNPLKADTDDDGLTDFQEVKTYLTNPDKADSDDDGYLDGAEVKSGYNPNGPGKLPPQ
jgi:hypothetical protein